MVPNNGFLNHYRFICFETSNFEFIYDDNEDLLTHCIEDATTNCTCEFLPFRNASFCRESAHLDICLSLCLERDREDVPFLCQEGMVDLCVSTIACMHELPLELIGLANSNVHCKANS